jgi:hypothetical protein
VKIIATIADGRWREVSRHRAAIQTSIESAQPRLSACIRLMFQAMVTRLHSLRTQARGHAQSKKEKKNSSSARHYDQISFRLRTAFVKI